VHALARVVFIGREFSVYTTIHVYS